MNIPTDKQMITAAKRKYHDEGTIEIDDNAKISRSDDNESKGAYVQAWVWVEDCDAEKGPA